MSMSCLMGSHGVFLATAVAVSGTVVLLVLCRQRPVSPAVPAEQLADDAADEDGAATPQPGSLRPCISDSKKKKQKQKQKKRVHFAEQLVELLVEGCDAEEENAGDCPVKEEAPLEVPHVRRGWSECGRQVRGGMPANRVALYSGILRDRHHRMACSY